MESRSHVTVTASGSRVSSEDEVLELAVGSMDGERVSPEHLLGAALSSCLLESVGVAGSLLGEESKGASIAAEVTLGGREEEPGSSAMLSIEVVLSVSGVEEKVLERALAICPMTAMLRDGHLKVERV